MARKSEGGSLLLLVLGIAWIASKCGGNDSPTSYSPTSPGTSSYTSPLGPETTSSVEAVGEELYVDADALNQRASPNGTVVGKLAGGDTVTVYERQGGWVRVSPSEAEPRWVSAHRLCTGNGCYRPKSSSRGGARARSRPRSDYGGSHCPCSGNNVCIGPRGGRYCITSGGNKRYGV